MIILQSYIMLLEGMSHCARERERIVVDLFATVMDRLSRIFMSMKTCCRFLILKKRLTSSLSQGDEPLLDTVNEKVGSLVCLLARMEGFVIT